MNDSLDRFTLRPARAVVFAATMAAFALGSGQAAASPTYPSALYKAAGMTCVPQCTVCHTVNPGVKNTAVQPFAIAMRGKGLLSGNPMLVDVAFTGLKNDQKPEYQAMVAALSKNLDPNYDESLGQLACGPSYGCGAHVAKAPPRDLSVFGWVLGALALFGLGQRVRTRYASSSRR
jgi:hypothetical protein